MSLMSATAAFAVGLLMSSCEPTVREDGAANPLVGKTCTIQFRRDALGMAASLPTSPTSNSINGAETSIQGLLRSTHGEWVVIESKGREVWIPKSVILSIGF